MVKIPLQYLKTRPAHLPAEYVDALLDAGNVAGEWLWLEWSDFEKLRLKYNPPKSTESGLAREIERATGRKVCEGCG